MTGSRLAAAIVAVAAGGVGGALIGVPALSGAQQFPVRATVNAAAGPADAAPPGRPMHAPVLLDAAAKALHLTTQQLREKLSDGKTTIADVAKQQHVDVNAVIDAMASADKDRIGDIVNRPWPRFGPGFNPADGAAGGPPGMHGRFGRLRALALGPVAKALGVSTDELRTELGKGRTIAQIAKSKNVDVNTVIDSLVGDASKRIDQAVTNGRLTQAQADKLKAALKTRIADVVDNGFPKLPAPGRFGFPGRRGWGGPMPRPGFGSTTTQPPSS